MKRIIRVGIVQQSCTGDIKYNLEKLHRNIASLAQAGAQLVVLQELHNSLYFCQTEDTRLFDLAEPIPGPSTGFYSEIAAAYGIVLVTSLFERRAAGLYHNTAVVFEKDGSIAGKPAPDIFLIAAEKISLPPKECLVIEDALAGIKSAQAAGIGKIYAIASMEPDEFYQNISGVDKIIHNFDEINRSIFDYQPSLL